MSRALRPVLGPVFLVATAISCGPSTEEGATSTPTESPTDAPTEVQATPTADPGTPTPAPVTLPEGCDYYVEPSDDDQTAIQTAFIEAQTGQTVCLAEGTFSLVSELSVATDGVTVKGAGMDKTVLDFTNQIAGANGILISGDDVLLSDLAVQETPGDGIRADKVEGISFLRVAVIWFNPGPETSGAYGLYPVGSTDVLIQECLVQGARDAGIYVGQSFNVLVVDNEARGNVAGIEIENTTDSEVVGNWAHGNTAGILIFNLPDLPVMDGKRCKMHDNLVEENNTENFAAEGNIIAIVPAGSGSFLLATDSNEIHDNIFKDNISGGIFIISYSELLVGTYDDPEFDPYPESNWIHDNIFDNNGTDPQGAAAAVAVAVGYSPRDGLPAVAWDGCMDPNKDQEPSALYNCMSNNVDGEGAPAGYLDFDLCGEEPFAAPSTDVSEVTCERESLATISL